MGISQHLHDGNLDMLWDLSTEAGGEEYCCCRTCGQEWIRSGKGGWLPQAREGLNASAPPPKKKSSKAKQQFFANRARQSKSSLNRRQQR